MIKTLITNDDGYRSPGFLALLKELSKIFSITAVAPDCEKSWIGKAITTKKTLKVKKINFENFKIYTLNATPADCVQIGLNYLIKNNPDLVISGINTGANIGIARMLSSGTIGAAIEASFYKIKSIASSLIIPDNMRNKLDFNSLKSYKLFEPAAEITAKIACIILENNFYDVDLFSVNIPFYAKIDTDIEITAPFKTPYLSLFNKTKYGFIHKVPPVEYKDMIDKTDIKAIFTEKISITPVNLSLVDKSYFKDIENVIKKAW
jgi:5'-nucleotidase